MNLLLQFCLVCSLIAACSAGKPGTCPEKGILPTVCIWECESDDHCPGEQKCCSYSSCWNSCETPTRNCNVICPLCIGYTPPGECCPICFGSGERRPFRQDPAPAAVRQESGLPKYWIAPVFGCVVNGVYYSTGATVPSKTSNPCEECTCQKGSVTCEIISCLHCVGYTPPGQCCPICGSWPHDIQ